MVRVTRTFFIPNVAATLMIRSNIIAPRVPAININGRMINDTAKRIKYQGRPKYEV